MAGLGENLSADLRIAFPEMKGFSARNLWYMKKWFLFYSGDEIKLHQLGAEFQQQKLPQLVGEIPWGHQREIITKCKSVDEALFYLRKTKQEGWSRAILLIISLVFCWNWEQALLLPGIRFQFKLVNLLII